MSLCAHCFICSCSCLSLYAVFRFLMDLGHIFFSHFRLFFLLMLLFREQLDKLNRPFCIVDSGGGGMWNCVKVIPEVLSRQMEDLREYLKLPGWLVSLMACIVALDDLKTQTHMH